LRYHIGNCVYYREGFTLDKEIYLLYIQQTVSSYSTKTKQHLLKQMVEKKIAIKDDNINGQFDIDGNENININGMSTENAIAYCLERNDEAIKLVEHWEFIKDY
jgi:hypothetical protein